MNRFLKLVAVILVVLFASSVFAQSAMPKEADEICKKQCYTTPRASVLVPDGEVGDYKLKVIDGGNVLEFTIHSKTDSMEWVTQLPAKKGITFVGFLGVRELELTYKKEGAGDEGSVIANVSTITSKGLLELPVPTREQKNLTPTYYFRFKWTQRDSFLTPLTPDTSEKSGRILDVPEPGLLSRHKLPKRLCSDCSVWWEDYLKRNPDAWKEARINLKVSEDFQAK